MRPLTERAAAIRTALLDAVEPLRGATICLSGGIDSASVLAASLACGYRPELLTFKLGQGESRDLLVARSMAEAFGLTLHVAPVRQDQATLVADLRRLLPIAAAYLSRAYEGKRTLVKVPVQVLHAMSYVADLAADLGMVQALSGFCADSYYGSGRAMNVLLQQEGEAAWDAYRRKYLVHPVNADLLAQHYFALRGVELLDVWAAPGVQRVMFGMSHAELNKPQPKAVAVHAFPEFWRRGSWVRPNESLQVVGGFREWHDTLLRSPLNRRGHKMVLGVYTDLLAETARARS